MFVNTSLQSEKAADQEKDLETLERKAKLYLVGVYKFSYITVYNCFMLMSILIINILSMIFEIQLYLISHPVGIWWPLLTRDR